MAPADQPSKKKKLFGWLSEAVSGIETAASEIAYAPPAPEAEKPAEPATPREPTRSTSGPLGGTVRSASLRLPGAGRPPAPRAPQTGELPETELPVVESPAPRSPGAPEDPAAASRRRMAFIVAYMKDPNGDPDFADKPLVYRVFAEERDYQQAQVKLLSAKLERAAGLAPAERADLEARLKSAQTRQGQLFMQLKKLTGVKGKTGGTGFLTSPDVLPEPKGLGDN